MHSAILVIKRLTRLERKVQKLREEKKPCSAEEREMNGLKRRLSVEQLAQDASHFLIVHEA